MSRGASSQGAGKGAGRGAGGGQNAEQNGRAEQGADCRIADWAGAKGGANQVADPVAKGGADWVAEQSKKQASGKMMNRWCCSNKAKYVLVKQQGEQQKK
jgi:hypothetical protein